LSCAVGAEFEYDKIKDIREKYMDTDSDIQDHEINIDKS
jgi:hypothetical protein